MTPCESVVKKIMGEPYAGNPQVRFEEEGGNPTFTLRFVDGMNLYRGYFAPKSLDPFGREDMPPAEIPKEEFHIEDLPKEVPEPPKESQPPSSEDLWPKDWDEARRQRERKKREREKREREKREREKREGPGGPGFNFNLDFTYITTTQDSDMVIEIQEMVTVVTRATNDPCE